MKSDKSKKGQKSAEKVGGGVDPAILKQLDEAYAKLNGPEGAKCHSLLKKHLTKETLEKLKNKKTKLGATLYDCIRSGLFVYFVKCFYVIYIYL